MLSLAATRLTQVSPPSASPGVALDSTHDATTSGLHPFRVLQWAARASGDASQSFSEGTALFYRGDPGSAAHLILTGEVRLLLPGPAGKDLLLTTRGTGDLVGEMAFLDSRPFPVTAMAARPTKALPISREVFLDVLARRPELALNVMCSLSTTLRETYEFIEDATFLDVADRLAKKLLLLAEEHGQRTDEGTLIGSAVTQRDLARMLGVTRMTVNKHLRSFRSRGLVDTRGQRILLRRPDLLGLRIY
jgi:CRP-like cAMP-binding protein